MLSHLNGPYVPYSYCYAEDLTEIMSHGHGNYLMKNTLTSQIRGGDRGLLRDISPLSQGHLARSS